MDKSSLPQRGMAKEAARGARRRRQPTRCESRGVQRDPIGPTPTPSHAARMPRMKREEMGADPYSSKTAPPRPGQSQNAAGSTG